MVERKEIWISYLEEDNRLFTGFLILVEITQAYIKVESKNNIITIPMNRVLKIKEHKVV